MKKSILLTSLIIFLFAGTSFAEDPDLFSYDKSVVETEMASLNELEQYVLDHPGVTLNSLKEEGIPLASSLSGANSYSALNRMYDKALGIGGFWWGCCLGPAGILVVYLVTEDKAETRSSIIGCVVGSLLYSGTWVAYAYGLNGGYYW